MMTLPVLLIIVVLAAHASRVSVEATTTFSAGLDITRYAAGINYVKATDIDGDGHLDVLFLTDDSRWAAPVVWFKNDGTGVFSEEGLELGIVVEGAAMLYAAGVDGDGDADLVGKGFDGVCWFENTSNQSYAEHTCVSTSSWGGDSDLVLPADIDGDGNIDLIVQGHTGNVIKIYLNADGTGSFESDPSYPPGMS